jgi:hypothetical protein
MDLLMQTLGDVYFSICYSVERTLEYSGGRKNVVGVCVYLTLNYG